MERKVPQQNLQLQKKQEQYKIQNNLEQGKQQQLELKQQQKDQQQQKQVVQEKQIVKKKRRNLCIFLGTTGIMDMHNLNDNFNYTDMSKYSRVHGKMSSEELQNRIMDMISKELDEKYHKITFIYSGHGWRSGIAPYTGVLEYKDLIKILLKGIENQKNASKIYEIRIILDCCYAANFMTYLGAFLEQNEVSKQIRKIYFIGASNCEEVAIALGTQKNTMFQKSPFFEYFFTQNSQENSYNPESNYKVTPKGKGMFLFEFGQLTNGKYERKSVAQRMCLKRDDETFQWKLEQN